MTLDEAIKHLEETLSDKSHKWSCESCKQEHKQLLAWLKELKALKEINGDISQDQLKQLDMRMGVIEGDLKCLTEKVNKLSSVLEDMTGKYQ